LLKKKVDVSWLRGEVETVSHKISRQEIEASLIQQYHVEESFTILTQALDFIFSIVFCHNDLLSGIFFLNPSLLFVKENEMS